MNHLIEVIKRGYRIGFSTDTDGLISVTVRNTSYLIKPTSTNKEIKQINGDLFIFNIENFEFDNDNLKVSGWAYFENQESLKTVINIVLVKEETTSALRLNTQKVNRPDVTKYFNSSYSIDHSGFQSNLDISNLDEGKYKIAIFLQNKETRKEGLIITDKEIEK
jgi:hypothetical protein